MGKRPQRVTTLTYPPDRLGRSFSRLVNFLSEIHAKKVDIFIHQQGIDDAGRKGALRGHGGLRRV
jgi:DNA invertase Pin-like site-specific DNA recombinase